MNQLNPQLKELLKIAQRTEHSFTVECEAPPGFVPGFLARLEADSGTQQSSVLEFMVKRGAVFAALIGLLTLTVEFSMGRPSLRILEDVSAPGAVFFRIVLR